MSIEMLRDFLGWCSVLNIGLLFLWVLFFTLAHGWVYRIHGKMFRLSEEQFDAIHYAGMAVFKMLVIVLNIVPYIALQLVG